jgi:hypothetical protein
MGHVADKAVDTLGAVYYIRPCCKDTKTFDFANHHSSCMQLVAQKLALTFDWRL